MNHFFTEHTSQGHLTDSRLGCGDRLIAGRSALNWAAIEHDYREGKLSLRELAVKHHCSHSAIANFAGRMGWPRRAAGRRTQG